MQTCLFAVPAQWFCGSHCWLNCVEFENIENCYFCWDCHFFGDNYFYRRVYSLDTVQDFLIKLGIKPCLHLFKISISFTKSCHCQTYQNYEQPPQSLLNFYLQSNFLASKIIFFFSMKNIWLGNQLLSMNFFENFDFQSSLFSENAPNFFWLSPLLIQLYSQINKGTSMYYVITKGERGSKKWQFLITFSTERNHKRGRGGQKTPNLDYVIHRCSLGCPRPM